MGTDPSRKIVLRLAAVLAVLLPVLAFGAATGVARAEPEAADDVAQVAHGPAAARRTGARGRPSCRRPDGVPSGLANVTGGPDGFGYTVDDNESHPAHGVMFQDISRHRHGAGPGGGGRGGAVFGEPR